MKGANRLLSSTYRPPGLSLGAGPSGVALQRKTKIRYQAAPFSYVDKSNAPQKQVVGQKMDAVLDPNDPVEGSGPGRGVQTGLMLALRHQGYKRMIRGHLMNGQMGGLGIAANLFPITTQANARHKTDMENYIKGQLQGEEKKEYPDDRETIRYLVGVEDVSESESKNWDPINVDFKCSAKKGPENQPTWQREVTIQSRPTKHPRNESLNEGVSKVSDGAQGGSHPGNPPARWGETGKGYSANNESHQKAVEHAEFFYNGNSIEPNNKLYYLGVDHNKGVIDAAKVEAYELVAKLEEALEEESVTLDGQVIDDKHIENCDQAGLENLIGSLEEKLEELEKFHGSEEEDFHGSNKNNNNF